MTQPEFSIGYWLANVAFTDKPFRFTKLSSGKLVLCGAGEAGVGVIQDEPLADRAGNVMIVGVSKIELGGSVSAMNTLKSDANGKAVAASATDQFIFGVALESGSSGEFIDMLLFGANVARESQAIVYLQHSSPAYAQAAEGTVPIARAPFDCTVVSVNFIANAALTGANTNSRTLSLINKGTDGSGSTVVASKAFTSGVNAVAFDETVITNTVTTADLDVDDGEVLALLSDAIASGLADPGGLIVIKIQRR